MAQVVEHLLSECKIPSSHPVGMDLSDESYHIYSPKVLAYPSWTILSCT
jgi:hypothetical protein